MRQLRGALGIAGILLFSLGTASCLNGGSPCLCVTSSEASKFAYVMLEFDTIAAFAITGGTGSLTPVPGSPFGGSISPEFGAADPAGKFLYAVVPGQRSVFGFSIDQTTGSLTAVPGSPFSLSPEEPQMAVVDPTGSFLYVSHQDSCGDNCTGAISAFKINTDGSLTEIEGSPYNTDYGTLGLAIHPSGKFLYAMNFMNCCNTPTDISIFQVNATTGALTEIDGSPFQIDVAPLFATIHPNGNFLYATAEAEGGSGVVGFSINPTSGALTPLSPFGISAGQNAGTIDIDGIDNVLFVANAGVIDSTDGSISAYQINATTGALTSVAGSPYTTTGSNPFQLAVDRSCKFLYVTNGAPRGTMPNDVLGFAINSANGTLTAVPGSPFSTPSGGPPRGIVLTPHLAATTP
jgi:6-phosphogluconolactonase (cycloisomerase 2 family)